MNTTTSAQTFLNNLVESKPQQITQFYQVLEDFQNNRVSEEDVFGYIKNLLMDNQSLVTLFNDNIIKDKQLRCLSKKHMNKMIKFVTNKVYEDFPELLGKYISISVKISESKLDNFQFFSIDHLARVYIEQLYQFRVEEQLLDKDIKKIEKIVYEYENKEDFSVNQEVGERDKNGWNQRQKKSTRENQRNDKLFVEEKCYNLNIYNIVSEDQIIDVIEQRLSKEDFHSFLKVFYLYTLNIISYYEFVVLSESFLFELNQSILVFMKKCLENRRVSRSHRNCFNIKNLVELHTPADNLSYKYLKLNYYETHKESQLINKNFMCIAHGNESGGNEDQSKHSIKNFSEENLLKIEDEMHEFDIIIEQLNVSRKLLNGIISSNDQRKIQKLIGKIKNFKILNFLYGKKSSQILKLLISYPDQISPIILNRLKQRLKLLEKSKSNYSGDNWQKTMKQDYYKALDVKSNYIKIIEKRYLINNSLLKSFKDSYDINRKLQDRVVLTKTIDNLLYGKKQNEYQQIVNTEESRFWNPAIAFEVKNKRIIRDIANVLLYFVKLKKNNNKNEASYISIIENFVMSVFNEKNPIEDQFGYLSLDRPEELMGQIKLLEKKQKKDDEFLYSDKLEIQLKVTKVKEVLSKLRNCQKSSQNKPSQKSSKKNIDKDFEEILNDELSERDFLNEMTIRKNTTRSKSNIFFGPYQYYILYRYFFFFYERFSYALKISQDLDGSDDLYTALLKVVIYYTFDVLDNNNCEDLFKMIFGSRSGVFLNLDKLFTNMFKISKCHDFSNFLFNLNKSVFSDKEEYVKEEFVFAKTCFKLNSLLNQTAVKSRNQNSNISSFVTNNGVLNNELLKFEYNEKEGVFIIHKIRSVFKKKGKNSMNSFQKILSRNYGIMMSISEGGCEQYISKNDIRYMFKGNSNKFGLYKYGQEDKVFEVRDMTDCKGINILGKLKKVKQLRDIQIQFLNYNGGEMNDNN